MIVLMTALSGINGAASGEPPLLLAASVHCATRAAIKEARRQLLSWSKLDGNDSPFQLDVPATLPVVKSLCGLDSVERYLKWRMSRESIEKAALKPTDFA